MPGTSAKSCTTPGRTPACSRRLAETSGGPEAVGRAILQDIREYSAGHVQVDDITLICFGPVARRFTTRDRLRRCPGGPSSTIRPVRPRPFAMSVKISNLRLELDDPEEVLPARAASRLGLDRRPSSAGESSARAWTPGGTTTSTSCTRWRSSSPEDEARQVRVPAGSRRPAFRPRAVRLARARLATLGPPARDHRRRPGRADRRLPPGRAGLPPA